MYLFRRDLKNKHQVEINVPHLKYMMCLNESCLNPYQKVQAEFLEIMKHINLNRYHSSITAELYQEIACYAGTQKDHLILGNGADEMLYYLFTAVRDNRNSFALSLSPSYFDYQSYCDATGLQLKNLSFRKDFSFDIDCFMQLAHEPDCRLIILCNPNNPTGNLLPKQVIIRIIEENPDILVLIDETYFEFSGITFVDDISKYNNLVIIRTFSKAFSAAGLRFGFLISAPENIKEIKKVVTAFNLSILTQAMALAIIRHKQLFLDYNQMIIREREKMYYKLKTMSQIQVFKSSTNFLLFRYKDYIDLFSYLKENEIAVRNVGNEGILQNCLRVSIADEILNGIFIKTVSEFGL
ncbi:MAG: histidinol-phosphate aminotransferase family protein [Candidatus Cloacimonetes bacterium]|nr:histidinol-phosphate aminotransferase family protein [Candidatus Cloacimonadota bacterium]